MAERKGKPRRAPWEMGEYVEYGNGFGSHVRHVDGAFAVLENMGTDDFILAHGDRFEFCFPFEEGADTDADGTELPPQRDSLSAAIADIVAAKEHLK